MIELPEFELNSHEELKDFLDGNRLQISLLTFEAIKKAIEEDLMYIPVMKLKISDMPLAVITVNRPNFTESLNKCLVVFQDAEYYEKCSEIIEILKDDRIR